MADIIDLTPQPGMLNAAATVTQEIDQAIDVSGYDELDLLAGVLALEGSGSPSVDIAIITGMQLESDEGWVTAASYTQVGSAPSWEKKTVTGLLRYVRWKVTLAGTDPSTVFVVKGMARRWASR